MNLLGKVMQQLSGRARATHDGCLELVLTPMLSHVPSPTPLLIPVTGACSSEHLTSAPSRSPSPGIPNTLSLCTPTTGGALLQFEIPTGSW